jgi:hypothetical protein
MAIVDMKKAARSSLGVSLLQLQPRFSQDSIIVLSELVREKTSNERQP